MILIQDFIGLERMDFRGIFKKFLINRGVPSWRDFHNSINYILYYFKILRGAPPWVSTNQSKKLTHNVRNNT